MGEPGRCRCIIFDLDDTLYCEREYVKQAMRHVAEYLFSKYRIPAGDSFRRMMELLDTEGRGRIFDRIAGEYGIEEPVAAMVDRYRDVKPRLSLYPDAEQFLKELDRYAIKTGIITDGCSRVQHNKIKGLHLEDKIDKIVVTADYENAAKPSVLPYRMVREALAITDPAACIYVGDNPAKDFVGARKDGMKTVRIVRPLGDYMGRKAEDGFEADERIHLLTELTERIVGVN